jgi:DNA-directed RNA polymerase specialized sigma24 family protein
MSGDQPLAVSPEEADAAFRSLYAEHGPALLRLSTALTGGDRILQIPSGTVRSRTFYGLRALRRALAAHDAVA